MKYIKYYAFFFFATQIQSKDIKLILENAAILLCYDS